MSIKVASKDQVDTILTKYDTFLFDCDGVLWLGDHLLPKIIETLNLLRSHNKKVIFVTNNSTKSRENYVSKFENFGLKVSKGEIFSSSFASAVYISTILKLPKDKKIWVLGQSGIEDELKEVGYTTIGGTDPRLNEPLNLNDPNSMIFNLDPDVGAVIAGLDLNMNYHKMSLTLQYLLQKPELPFIATNIDSTYPSKGLKLAGAGSVIESVAFAAGRQPMCSCGKPNPGMMDAIVAKHAIDRSKTIMVGDRLNTDMKFGRDGGLDTLLVLTGIETMENVEKLATDEQPTYVANKLGDLYEYLQ
ncbi:hypothetical protein CANARDRAFT_27836 [[Candida] arabinofermentans NRRL YB-2248]|uniref:4-nitrophenylphosphatase n=1 Tax=[Candida] arabinofermentans NRRL YB-2248 TaxID=983967 RepID=A0A1E4T1Z3_9ASCO|nr:hypothetical protein CANARDRAFT_27836 [[Candida] arabinofermentans NRRL YB-2248]